jgi:RNA polymerase sigma-70 factor, ECF subfamily
VAKNSNYWGEKMGDLQDYDIVKAIQHGDTELFTSIVKKYDKALIRLVGRHIRDKELVKDIVQEALFKAYQHVGTFEFRCSFKNWLYKIAVNTARNKLRSLKDMENIDEVVIVEVCQLEGNLMYDELKVLLRSLIEQLPEKQKQTLELRVFQDMSFKEVAHLMDCPYDTAKANYRHAMLKLKDYFKNKTEEFTHSA